MRYRAVLLLCVLLACSPESPTTLAPSQDLAFELTDVGTRIQPGELNAHMFGSFRVAATAAGGGVITTGPANFPGHPPAGPGTCVDGKWYNAQGKGTSGTMTKPHPHCFRASAAIEVVLEPISACFQPFGLTRVGGCLHPADPAGTRTTRLKLDNFGKALVTGTTTSGGKDGATTTGSTTAIGIVTGYAIDAATLGTTNRRVGTLSITLGQYDKLAFNVFDLDDTNGCELDATIIAPCLNRIISSTYNPLPAPNGLGPTDFNVEGFLWLTPASTPYNYLDDENYVRAVICREQFEQRYGQHQIPFSEIGSVSDAESWCLLELGPGANIADCGSRVGVLANVITQSSTDPCLAAA